MRWELNIKEIWREQKRGIWNVVLEKYLEYDGKNIKPMNQYWMH